MIASLDRIRIVIVADDPLVRAGLAALLVDQPECLVVGQLGTGEDLPSEVLTHQPDVILWDLGWDPAPALEAALDSLLEVGLPMVVLLPGEGYAAEAWGAGAAGILPRDVAVEDLLATLVSVSRGLIVLDPSLASGIRPPVINVTPDVLVDDLTPREMEVLQLLADGLTNRAIAQRLSISEHTVKFHVNSILGKLGAQSRTEAVVRATRMGLILF
jgi:DNA-binding NarL/FixJ family response regulator